MLHTNDSVGHDTDAAVPGVPDEYARVPRLPGAYVVLKPEVAAVVLNDPRLTARVKTKLYEVRPASDRGWFWEAKTGS